MVVYNALVVEYDVENLVDYLKGNTVEKDSCLSFDIEMLKKMKEAGIKTFKKEFCETPGLWDLREYLTTKYKEELKEYWSYFFNESDFELYLDYLMIANIKDFCLKKKEKGEELHISKFLDFFEKNWKHIVDYDVQDDGYYPIWSIRYETS